MFEKIVIENLLHDNSFIQKFIGFIDDKYFEDKVSNVLFKLINKYYIDYKKAPFITELATSLQNEQSIDETTFKNCIETIKLLKTPETYNPEWLTNETKKWIRNSAFKSVIYDSAVKLDNGKPLDDLMENVKTVFNINFNETIGNNFKNDYKEQFDFYQLKEEKIECNITELNNVCGGGVERKSLNILMAPTNTGKTSAMISLASSYLRRGYNVLYITCEMAERKIRQRFDANFLNIPINDIPALKKEDYFSRMEILFKSLKTNLIIKEYPTSMANVNHLRGLLNSLANKENFVPDIVMVDYLNLLNSIRVKAGKSYEIVKAIAEEVRGLACEYNMCFWSATQTNREGDGASDLDITDVSESYGLPMTADLLVAIIQTEELKKQGRQIWKNLKDRYSGLKFYKFPVNHDFSLCQVSDCRENGGFNNEPENIESMKEDIRQKVSALDDDFFN